MNTAVHADAAPVAVLGFAFPARICYERIGMAIVSKALRGVTTISADMREKILAAAKEYGISHEPAGAASGNTVLCFAR